MKKDITLKDKIIQNLFRSTTEVKHVLSEKEIEIKKRYMAVVAQLLDEPMKMDKDLIYYLIDEFKIKQSQAYRDMANIRFIVGGIRSANKEWVRYSVNEGLKKQYKKADEAGKEIAAIMALDKMGKYNMLDKIDEETIPWEDLIPADFDMTDDVSVLDPKLKITNVEERRLYLREKYGKAVDTNFEQI